MTPRAVASSAWTKSWYRPARNITEDNHGNAGRDAHALTKDHGRDAHATLVRYSPLVAGNACHETPTTSRSRLKRLVICSILVSSRSVALRIALITVCLSSFPTALSTSCSTSEELVSNWINKVRTLLSCRSRHVS